MPTIVHPPETLDRVQIVALESLVQSTSDLTGSSGETVCSARYIGEHGKSVRILPAFDTKYEYLGKGSMHGISVGLMHVQNTMCPVENLEPMPIIEA